MDVRLTGFHETIAKFDMIKSAMPKVASTSLESVLQLGQNVAQAIVPVRTGFLQRSIGYNVGGLNNGTLFATAPYAARINYGDSKVQPRPFFDLAVMEMAAQFSYVVWTETELALKIQDPHVLNLRASRAYESFIRKTHGVTAKAHHISTKKYPQRFSITKLPSGRTRSNYVQRRPGQQRPSGRNTRHRSRGSVGGKYSL